MNFWKIHVRGPNFNSIEYSTRTITHTNEGMVEPTSWIICQARHFRNLKSYPIENIDTQSNKVKEDGLHRCIWLATYRRAGEQEQIVRILSQQLRGSVKYFATWNRQERDGFGKVHYATSFNLSMNRAKEQGLWLIKKITWHR